MCNCARKEEHDQITEFCTQGCCSPKMFTNIWFGVWSVLAVLQVVGLFLGPGISVYQWVGLVLNLCFVVVYVMSLIKSNDLVWISTLSYLADFGFVVSIIMMVLFGILMLTASAVVSSAADEWAQVYDVDTTGMGMTFVIIVLVFWAFMLWLNYWACRQIREAVFRQQYEKHKKMQAL